MSLVVAANSTSEAVPELPESSTAAGRYVIRGWPIERRRVTNVVTGALPASAMTRQRACHSDAAIVLFPAITLRSPLQREKRKGRRKSKQEHCFACTDLLLKLRYDVGHITKGLPTTRIITANSG